MNWATRPHPEASLRPDSRSASGAHGHGHRPDEPRNTCVGQAVPTSNSPTRPIPLDPPLVRLRRIFDKGDRQKRRGAPPLCTPGRMFHSPEANLRCTPQCGAQTIAGRVERNETRRQGDFEVRPLTGCPGEASMLRGDLLQPSGTDSRDEKERDSEEHLLGSRHPGVGISNPRRAHQSCEP